ncbi:PDDEXK nuclease domain-containing protein [Aquimarina agarivorans]|uniref:PDDEXK nuclease domain-containing protein n=1 Tax=Aquimarina agarivorans TaxID=980584 RepID=UPI000248EB87|nr:PDDEXK nuclease domain-containing protein [Aquimarina agarivorans]
MSITENKEYLSFFAEIKEHVYQSQYKALKQVNKELIALYWDVGSAIVKRQEEFGWGKSVVETLSADLQKEFVGVKGFSSRNLWYMRNFYNHYNANKKLQPLVAEIGWSHNILILDKCKDDLEREFYIRMTRKYGWTKSVLIHQIEGKSYERFLLNQTNFDSSLEEKYRHQAKLAVKDSYSFDFLGMSENYGEREMELSLIKNIRSFLMEMGSDFAFIANQYKVSVGEDDFYIDLLLYHRRLKCLVVVELKTTKFKPEHAGQMQFYLTALDEQEKEIDENPSIGIIICKGKNRTVVEYALKRVNAPMGVADYTITEQLPEDMQKLLPSSEEIAAHLEKYIK